MKRKSIVFVCFALLVIVALFAFTACSENGGTGKDEKKIVSLTAEVPETDFVIGQIDYSKIPLIVKYNNGETKTVFLTENMIDPSDRAKLLDGAQPGTRQIRVAYEGFSTKIDLKLVLPKTSYYTITLVGGYVSAVNGTKIVSPVIPEDGGSFSESYAAGTVLTLTWKTVSGKHFERWTVDNVEIDGESIINVTVNANVEYRAYSSSVVNTVSFVVGFDDLAVKPKTTNVLNERDIETLAKDGYVFLGWTTDQINETDARSGYEKNRVTFPYVVTRDATLYGVWTPIGIVYTEIADGYAVSAFNGNVSELVIPDTYNGRPVTTICSGAFTLPKSGVITKITLPSSLQRVEEGAFADCRQLKEILVADGSERFVSENGVLYEKGKKTLCSYPAAKVAATYVIPDETSDIASKAFFDAAVGGIRLGANVKRIGNLAFDGATVSYVDFYDVNPSELNIAKYLFNRNVSQICVAESKKSIFESNSADFKRYANKIVTDRNELSEIGSYSTIEPDGKKAETVYRVIKNDNFEIQEETAEIITTSRDVMNYTLQIYTQGEKHYTITSLGPSAFARCVDLSVFRIPSGSKLERICDGAFDDTPWIETLTSDAIIANDVYYKYLGGAETVKFGSLRIDKIAEGAFSGKTELKYLDITDNASLKVIAAYAFYECTNFRGFKCKRNQNGNGLYLKSGVEKIGAYAFYGTSITGITVQLEDQTTTHEWKSIGGYAFGNCDLLSYVQMPVAIEDIAYTAFIGCTALEKFELIGDRNRVRTEENKNRTVRFEVHDGVLYDKKGDEYVLYCYPAGRIEGEFDPSLTTEKIYATSIEKDETQYIGNNGKTKVGAIHFNEQRIDLYLTITVDDYSKLQSGDIGEGIVMYGERPLSETTEIINGVANGEKLFSIIDGNDEILLLYDEVSKKYYYYNTLRVTEFAPHALYDANIGALVVPETVEKIPSTAIDVKGLTYVLFKGNPPENYKDIFTGAEPSHVVIPEQIMVGTNRKKFYNDSEVQAAKDRTTVPYRFFYAYGEDYDRTVLYGLSTENATVSVVRTSRTAVAITVPKEIYVYKYSDGSVADFTESGKKRVLAYAFFGGKLKEVYLRQIDEICNNAFTEAYEMTKLDLNGDFISKLGNNVFGSKFGNGLFVYDYTNGAELYASVENWQEGMSFFTYGTNGDKKAAKYLISDPKGPFAVIQYLNGEQNVFVELQYDTITAEEVATIRANIGKKGYEITYFIRADGGETIPASSNYSVEYNQILTCMFTPKEYVVYIYASETVVFDENFKFVSKNETGLVKYETKAVYGENYSFEPVKNGAGKYFFLKFFSNDEIISASGVWNYEFDNEAELLVIVGYKLVLYDKNHTFDEKIVFAGKSFSLDVPKPKEGEEFVGWALKADDTQTLITDNKGKSSQEWQETGSDEYKVYAVYEKESQ